MKHWSLKSQKKIWNVILGSCCGLLLLGGQVWGLGIINSFRTSPEVFTDSVAHVLALNNTGGTSLTITTTGTTQLTILFNAVCSVDALDDTTYIDIDILVDGAAAPPSQAADNALCTSTGDGALQHWVSTGMSVVKTVGAGTHTVQVRGTVRGFTAGDRWLIDNLSLIVLRQP